MLQNPIWQLIFLALALCLAAMLHQVTFLKQIQMPEAITDGILLAVFYNSLPELGLSKGWLKTFTTYLLDIFYITLYLKGSSNYLQYQS